MKGVIIGVIAAVIIIGAIIFTRMKPSQPMPATQSQQQSQQQGQPANQNSAQPTTPLAVTVNLSAQNGSGEMGTATLTEMEGGKTKVEINLTGAPQGVVQPAHIHTGACPNPGAVAFPLTFPVNGKSETIINVSLRDAILNKLPMAVNVHKSAAEASVYVSCGDIKMPGTSAQQNASPSTAGQGTTNPAQVEDNRQGAGQFSTPTDNRKGATKPED